MFPEVILCHIKSIIGYIITYVAQIQHLIFPDPLTCSLQLIVLIIAHGQRSIYGTRDIEIGMRYKGHPVDIQVSFPSYCDGQHRGSRPEVPHPLAVQALDILQRLVRYNHQTALLEILQHIHQLAALVDHLHGRNQLEQHQLAFSALQTIDVCTGGCRVFEFHV